MPFDNTFGSECHLTYLFTGQEDHNVTLLTRAVDFKDKAYDRLKEILAPREKNVTSATKKARVYVESFTWCSWEFSNLNVSSV